MKRTILVTVLCFGLGLSACGGSSTSDEQSKPSGTANSGYIACRSKEWLSDMFAFQRNNDRESWAAYGASSKCILLKDGMKVSITHQGGLSGITEFVYLGTKYYAPFEAINP